MEAKSIVEIPLGRSITAFEEVHLSMSYLRGATSTSSPITLRLNDISTNCYSTSYISSGTIGSRTVETTSNMLGHTNAINNISLTNSTSPCIVDCVFKPSKSEDFFQSYVLYSISVSKGIDIGEFTGWYDPTLGSVSPDNISFLTISLGGNFVAGMQINVWGIVREQKTPLDIPVVEMPYLSEWTEFIEDVSNINLTTSIFNRGNDQGRIQRFTGNGVFNIVKNRKYKLLGVSGGAGGCSGSAYGSGSHNPSWNGTAYGGIAGSPGLIKTRHLILPVDLPLNITIGSGGSKGPSGGSSVSGAWGKAGSSGGTTSFGNFLTIFGGVGRSGTIFPGVSILSGEDNKIVNASGESEIVGWLSYLNEKFGTGGAGGTGTLNKNTISNYYSAYSQEGANGGPGVAFIMW